MLRAEVDVCASSPWGEQVAEERQARRGGQFRAASIRFRLAASAFLSAFAFLAQPCNGAPRISPVSLGGLATTREKLEDCTRRLEAR